MIKDRDTPPVFTATPTSIIADISRLIETSRIAQEAIADPVTPSTASYDNVLLALSHAENALASESTLLVFYKAVSPSPDIRAASAKARNMLRDFAIECSMNECIFCLVDAVQKHKEFVKNGLRIPAGPQRDCFKEVKGRIEDLTSEFSKNVAEADHAVWFTLDELDEYPQHLLAHLEKGQTGRVARNPETRKRALAAFENRCPENVAVFRQVMALRHEAARLLGYANHAAFSVEDRMAGSPQRVNTFLSSLRSKLTQAGKAEREALLEVKRRDAEARGEAFDGRLYVWDVQYDIRLLSQERYSVDQEKIAEYFPLQPTVEGMLRIFQHLFGMVFHEIQGGERDTLSPTGKGDSEYPDRDDLVWHEDVQTFAVWDVEGEGALPPASANPPSLLRHSDVVMLFHELGHGIHELVSRTQLARFHGPMGTAVDFGEAPSQMLENWCWDPEQLSGLSRHYSYLSEACLQDWQALEGNSHAQQPPERIPRDVAEGLLRSKHVGGALSALIQLSIGIFDMAVHQPSSQDAVESTDFTKFWNELRREMVPTDDPSALGEGGEWGHGYTNWDFLMDEYDAGFYGYLFSTAYAQDIFSTVFKKNPMSEEAGRRYRYGVLEKGGRLPQMKTLANFLGPDVLMEPFYEDLGLAA
ncbi:peptidase family M3 [Colletotrichum graminicola M1.001]|uniref:Peptidase family M3 n=1 Tax=Colletotrichum graminicola (strain M1.001 / M2 / FGSC 10212) TaxID=645133 RepID=E3Q8T2_COLGM|nr:peptidase family M3 [Colletotrichum graminicola M1.001]EFQ27446.1 peptidase family M3 [Colletotrichum graminicola M1.001]